MWRLIEALRQDELPAGSAQHPAHGGGHARRLSTAGGRSGLTPLVQESMGKVMAEIGTHARHVIDIVVRNLYERTADVGFLATDQELCRFVAGTDNARLVLARLREYRSK